MRNRERGIGNLAFISVLVLFVIALAMFFVTKDDADNQKTIAKEARANVKKAEIELEKWKSAYSALREVVAIDSPDLAGGTDNVPDPAKIQAAVRNEIFKVAEACDAASVVLLNSKNFSIDESTGKILSQEGDVTKLKIFSNPISRENGTVAAFLALFPKPFVNAKKVAEVNNNKNTATALRAEAARGEYATTLEKGQNAYQNDINSKQAVIDQQRGDLTNIRESLTAQGEKFDSMSTEVEQTKQVAIKAARSSQLQISALNNRINNERIRKELALAEDPRDGGILAVSKSRGTVYIDLGKRNRLSRGTKFKVWRAGKGNRRVDIAVIKVLQVDDGKAECSVISRTGAIRVTKGMNISNPFFDPHGKLRAYIFGDLSKYTTEVARRRLAAAGVSVARHLDDTVNLIILGEPRVTIEDIEDEEDAEAINRKKNLERSKRLDEILEKARSINALVVSENALTTFVDF